MGQVIVRNLDDYVVDALKNRAARHGHSLEQELRMTLVDTVTNDRKRFIYDLKSLYAQFKGREYTDATLLIREDRDR